MFKHEALLWWLILVPMATGGLAAVLPSPRKVLGTLCAGVGATAGLGWLVAAKVFVSGPVSAGSDWLYLDALSAYNLGVMLLIYGLSSAYAWTYFEAELRSGHLTLKQARLFAGLWCEALAAMTLVFVSNNLGIMWVGIEATTLLTGFLICVHVSRESLEAMWKYILICSVGVAFAFMGTLLIGAATRGLRLSASEALLWTKLQPHAALLDPALIKAAFVFLLVGYGTKAGLAPMHNWLPDAHSQAPAPVSAIFSGFMLNTALYCVMRYVPIIEAATGNTGWGLRLLIGFGLFSILVAAAFILFQHDLKRLLAYHSVEHLGIITLGVGLGGLGTFAALFHTLNHSLCKTLAFFAAGRLGQMFGSHDMGKLAGDATMGHAIAYCQAVEALAGCRVPARAHTLRAIALELERLANHTGDLGALAGDVGYLPTMSYCGRIRGDFRFSREVCAFYRKGRYAYARWKRHCCTRCLVFPRVTAPPGRR